MLPKPRHLGPADAAQFTDPAIVAAYRSRPPYPDAVFESLVELIGARPRAVLDIGCGTGDRARRLVDRVDGVDAVDMSLPMIEVGRRLPGGDHPRLRLVRAPMDEAPLDPPYRLVIRFHGRRGMVGANLVFAPSGRSQGSPLQHPAIFMVKQYNCRRESALDGMGNRTAALAPGGFLAIVERIASAPWETEVLEAVKRYSTNRDFQPYDLVDELTRRGLFECLGAERVTAIEFGQSLEAYVESWHSRNGLSRDRMPPDDAEAFDARVRQAVQAVCGDRPVVLELSAAIVWGGPAP